MGSLYSILKITEKGKQRTKEKISEFVKILKNFNI